MRNVAACVSVPALVLLRAAARCPLSTMFRANELSAALIFFSRTL
jgi:hypothetical protein